MAPLYDRPFLTDKFDAPGGGLDFLGMRQVNLAILQEELIPELNNATASFGVFCVGAWIPWKYRHLTPGGVTAVRESQYLAFQEAIEVAMAYAVRDDSPLDERLGASASRMGVQSQPRLPGKLSFEAAGRSDATSLYAAPLYGPALRFLHLLQSSNAETPDGGSTDIPVCEEDADTCTIVEGVEAALAKSQHFARVVRLDTPEVSGPVLDDMGLHGLHPSYYRAAPAAVKRAFLRKLFRADEAGRKRRLTADLILATVVQTPVEDVETLRRCWYTGLLPGGNSLSLDPELTAHRLTWSVFQARQIQRTAVELLLRCFELGLRAGCRDVGAVVDYWRGRSPADRAGVLAGTVRDLVRAEARAVYQGDDPAQASRAWNAIVHGGHGAYDDEPETTESAELCRALRTLARWWVRTLVWIEDGRSPQWMEYGGAGRLALGWVHRWVGNRLDQSVESMLGDAFTHLVFAQHVRVAIMRFDDAVQKLRFTLGDDGLAPTAEVGKRLGSEPVRTADRLRSFVSLLDDVGVLKWADGKLAPGPLSASGHGKTA